MAEGGEFDVGKGWAILAVVSAGVAQMAERLLPKQDVVGSSPITRSTE